MANSPSRRTWILDSGASHHICPDRRAFQSLSRLSRPVDIILADESAIQAREIGFIRIHLPESSRFFDIEALYAPCLRFSLLSIVKLSEAFIIGFNNGNCLIQRHGSTNTAILGRSRNGLCELAGQAVRGRILSFSPIAHNRTISAAIATQAKSPSLIRWHQRLGHMGQEAVKKLVENHSASGSGDLGILSAPCDVCVKAKHRRTIIRKPVARTTRPFELIHSDLCGPLSTPSVGGSRYFIVYIDDFSRSCWVYFLRGKDKVEVTSRFQEFKAYIDKHFPSFPITRFRCDNGRGEYDNGLFRGILRVSGVTFEPSPPYTQHKNGVSERMIQTLTTKARAMLIDSRLPPEMWAEAIETAAYLHARSPSRSLDFKTPYKVLRGPGKVPEISHLRRFGCRANKLIPKEQRVDRKFGPRSKPCIMLGYVHDTTKIWKLWDPESRRVFQASDVLFDEDTIVGSYTGPEEVIKPLIDEEIEEIDENHEIQEIPAMLPQDEEGPIAAAGTPAREEENSGEALPRNCGLDSGVQNELVAITPAAEDPLQPSLVPPRRSARARIPRVLLATSDGDMDPEVYEEAAESEDWRAAMREEFSSLLQNETWETCERRDAHKTGKHAIGCKWVYKTKTNADGSLRYKARLVIRGYEQVPGEDFDETFAPVARLETFRIILALAATNRLHIHQMDVVTAFLNPDIDGEVYMELPPGIENSWLWPERANRQKTSHDTIRRLLKALYGLKQAPHLWFKHIDAFLRSLGFCPSDNDGNLYIAHDVWILLYVDDLLIVSQSEQRIAEIKQQLHDQYRMTDLGVAKQFLGLEIHYSDDRIYLRQRRYAQKVLRRFQMFDAYPHATPLDPGTRLTKATKGDQLVDPKEYQALTGSLMYLMRATRPDLAFTVSALAKHNSKPTHEHLQAAKHALRYLKGTVDMALVYQRNGSAAITGYTDSDWAGDLDDRKSTSGFVFKLSGAAVTWSSRKQSLVAQSSTEAEYIGCSEAAREAVWLRRLLGDLQAKSQETPITLHADNQGSIKLTENTRFHGRTKHIEIRYHFVREAHQNGAIRLTYLPTAAMTADILTKSLPKETHQQHVYGLGLVDSTAPADATGSADTTGSADATGSAGSGNMEMD